MFPPGSSYEAICAEFRWQVPARVNMARDVCDRWAAATPDAPAIIEVGQGERRDVSFARLRAMADTLAAHLAGLGVARGDRVGIFRTQSAWTAAAHVAVWKLGAISMPLFRLFGEEALSVRLGNAGARVAITDPEGAERLAGLDLPMLREVVVPEALATGAARVEPADTAADDPAVLIYTSGTTGPPKGALLAHRSLIGHMPAMRLAFDNLPQPGDVLWTPADWAWIGAFFDTLMPGLGLGLPVVAARAGKFSAEFCREVLDATGATCVFFPPTALKMLKAAGFSHGGLRAVASGGEALGAELLDWGRESLGLTINEMYGQTECNLCCVSSGTLFAPRPGCIGRPVPGFELAVIDAAGRPAEGEGDIAVRRGPPVMMLEYWNNPEATAAKFRGDWMLMGDRGVMEDGYLRFVGRDDDVITSAGYRIGPAEIEDCLLRHPAVAAAGVVGKDDPERTQIVCAFVVLRTSGAASDALAEELKNHVKTRLSAHEYPREVHFVEALPMTVTGKIRRGELRALANRRERA